MSTLAVNKRARFDYEISDIYEAGMVLRGYEVKSIKLGHISLKGAFVTIKSGSGNNPEMYLTNAHVSKYKKASTVESYDPERPKKLLLHSRQIGHLLGKKKEQGLTLVPLKVYSTRGLIKLEFGIGKGKKKYDKRESIKKREADLQIRRVIKERH